MSYRSTNPALYAVRTFLYRDQCPVTLGVIAINTLVILLVFIVPAFGALRDNLICYLPLSPAHAYTALTFPFVQRTEGPWDLVNFAILAYVFYQFGGPVERSWGSGVYAGVLVAANIVTVAVLSLAGMALGIGSIQYGFYLSLAAAVTAFATMNPNMPVQFWFFPMRAGTLGIVSAVLTCYAIGSNATGPGAGLQAFYGALGCAGLALVWAYTRYGRDLLRRRPLPRREPDLYLHPQGKTTFKTRKTLDGSPRPDSPFDIAGRIQAWKERKRLEKLLRNSGFGGSEWNDDDKPSRP